MFRRTVYEVCGFYPDKEAEDFAYFSKVVRHFRTSNIDEIVLDYRESLTNRSHQAAKRIAESVKVQALENYEAYLGNTDGFNRFFRYQHDGHLMLSDFFNMQVINLRLLNGIFSRYGKSRFSWEFAALFGKILCKDILLIQRR